MRSGRHSQWLTGAIVIAVGVGIGATQGRALFGGVGAVVGTVAGASAAIYGFFRVILPWRARRVLPSVIDRARGNTLDDVRHADESLRRMVDAYNRREAVTTDETADRRAPPIEGS